MWLFALACAPSLTAVLDADAARSGADGDDGPFGVAAVSLNVASRATGAIPVEVWVPTEAGDALQGAPALVHVHGGFVAPERYDWLAIHAASRGYVVVAPHSALNLALFESGNAEEAWTGVVAAAAHDRALTGVADASTRRAVAGHSLGGVVASIAWVNGGWDGVLIEASFPAGGTPVEDVPGPVLSLIGTQDGSADDAAVEAGFARFPGPGWFGRIDGMTHYDWTDEASASDQKQDGTATRPQADTRRDAQRIIDAWLDATLTDDADAAARLDGEFAGIDVRRTP